MASTARTPKTTRGACIICETPGARIEKTRQLVGIQCVRCGEFRCEISASTLLTDRLSENPNRALAASNKIRSIYGTEGIVHIDLNRARRLLSIDPIFSDSHLFDLRVLSFLKGRAESDQKNSIAGWAAIGNVQSDSEARLRLDALVRGGFIATSKLDMLEIMIRLTEAGLNRIAELSDRKERSERRASEKAPFTSVYASHVTVDNIRCFSNRQTLELLDDQGGEVNWTILLGDNGVGKSSLLQFIAALFPNRELRSDEIRSYETQLESYELFSIQEALSDPEKPASIELRIQYQDDKGQNRHANFGVYVNSSSRDIVDELKFEFDDFEIRRSPRHRGLVFYSGGTNRLGELPLVVAYGATRAPALESKAFSVGSSNANIGGIFHNVTKLRDPEEWLLKADYSARFESRASRRAKSQYQSMCDMLIRLLPDIRKIEIVAPQADDLAPSLKFKTPYGSVGYHDLSVGYQTMLSMAADLAIKMIERYETAEFAFKEHAIVLIDEVDLHLHPKWQQEAMGWLTSEFPNVQFIATSHSPIIAQGASELNLAVMRRVDNTVEILNRVDEVREWRVDQILTSEVFGLNSLMPIRNADRYHERLSLLRKADLNFDEAARLAELNEFFDSVPTAGSLADNEAMEIIRRAAQKIKSKK